MQVVDQVLFTLRGQEVLVVVQPQVFSFVRILELEVGFDRQFEVLNHTYFGVFPDSFNIDLRVICIVVFIVWNLEIIELQNVPFHFGVIITLS